MSTRCNYRVMQYLRYVTVGYGKGSAAGSAGIGRPLHLRRIDIGKINRVLARHSCDGARKPRGIEKLEDSGRRGKGHLPRIGRDDFKRLAGTDSAGTDRKSTRLNSSHLGISYA